MSQKPFFALVAACLLTSAGACSQDTVQPAPAPPQAIYRIAGTVVDSVSEQPISRVTVAILSTPGGHTLKTALTEADGHFAFSGLRAGKYSLTASKIGYRPAYFDQHEQYNSAIVAGEGQETEDLTFPITASAALRIAVTDDFGEPVEKAQIYLFHRVHSNGMGEQLTPWKLPPTKGTGEGAVYLLEPGDYYVAVSAHPWYALNNITESGTPPVAHPANPALDVAYPTTYFDGVTNEAEATAVTLAPGSRERIAITLHAVPAVRVTLPAPPAGVGDEGQVERPPELLPIIFGAPMEQPDRSTMEESERGGTEITGVAPGAYEVREGERRRRVLLNLSHSQDLSSNAGSGAAALKVTIKGIAKNALPADARLFLFWGDKTHPRQPMQAKFENNECEFGIVPPGNWELFIGAGMSGFPIIATSFDGQMHTGNRLHVMGKPLDVELSVRTAPTVVDGFAMREGKGKAGVLVLLVPHDPENHTDLIRRDQSDSDGSFTSRAVPPGAYTVVAIENGWNLEWQRPEILARYLPGGVVVSVPDQPEPLYHLTAAVPIQAPITSVTSEPEHQEVRQVR